MHTRIGAALAVGQTAPVRDDDDDRRRDPSRPPTLGRRAARRRRVLLTALAVDLKSDSIISCRVEDVSESGARIKLAERRFLPPTFWLIAVTSGLAFSVKTIWRKDVRLGIETGPPVDLADPGSRDERRLSKIWAARR